jgi:hypothetical protein
MGRLSRAMSMGMPRLPGRSRESEPEFKSFARTCCRHVDPFRERQRPGRTSQEHREQRFGFEQQVVGDFQLWSTIIEALVSPSSFVLVTSQVLVLSFL